MPKYSRVPVSEPGSLGKPLSAVNRTAEDDSVICGDAVNGRY
jgi:hypothetical protein